MDGLPEERSAGSGGTPDDAVVEAEVAEVEPAGETATGVGRAEGGGRTRTALALVQPAPLLPTNAEWRTMMGMAEALFRSGLLPAHVRSPQAALAVIQKGRELQVPPMYALTNIVVIQGKPTANAELMLALIYRDHGDEAIRITETTAERCTIAYRRRSWSEPQSYTFTIEDAIRAGLAGGGNPAWQKYPQAMLRARAISAVARMAFPDSIAGMYTPEELGARVRVDEDGEIVPVLTVAGSRSGPTPTTGSGRRAGAPPQHLFSVSPTDDTATGVGADGEAGAAGADAATEFTIDANGPRRHPLQCMAVLVGGRRCDAVLRAVRERPGSPPTPPQELLRRMRARGVPADVVLCLEHAARYIALQRPTSTADSA